jgi:hypothetical protein
MKQELIDRAAIRQIVDDWVIYRDAGDWERFRSVWHEDGCMITTWTQGSVDDFIEMRRKARSSDRTSSLHLLGGHSAQIVGSRALAQTKMQILHRARVEGVLCDVMCTGRFFDFLEKRSDRWGFVYRQPIYEKDRLDPVELGAMPMLDVALLASFPEGYRHLAYSQSRLGLPVRKNLPGLNGAAVEALYARGRAWLNGARGHPQDL